MDQYGTFGFGGKAHKVGRVATTKSGRKNHYAACGRRQTHSATLMAITTEVPAADKLCARCK